MDCFKSLATGMSPFFLLMAVSALFGANTVTANGQQAHGVAAIAVCLVLNLVFPAIFAGVQKFGYFILSLIQRRTSSLK